MAGKSRKARPPAPALDLFTHFGVDEVPQSGDEVATGEPFEAVPCRTCGWWVRARGRSGCEQCGATGDRVR